MSIEVSQNSYMDPVAATHSPDALAPTDVLYNGPQLDYNTGKVYTNY